MFRSKKLQATKVSSPELLQLKNPSSAGKKNQLMVLLLGEIPMQKGSLSKKILWSSSTKNQAPTKKCSIEEILCWERKESWVKKHYQSKKQDLDRMNP